MKETNVFIAIIFTIFSLSVIHTYAKGDIYHNVLRLHVIANSDEEHDQQLKLAVRDRILAENSELFATSKTVDEAEAKIDTARLEAAARDVIEAAGYDYEVEVEIGRFAFGAKSYGDIIFPAGTYNAVRVIIGDGNGRNWWCVMYPPLCMVKETGGVLPPSSLEKLKKSLSPAEYKRLTEGTPIQVKFKIAEMFK